MEKVDPSKNEYYLYVGRVSKEKGVDLFCQAISELDYKGIVVGDGDERQKIETEFPNIEFTGWKNKDEVKQYMKGAKALIFPSKWYEGAPLTPLEAMQYGVPCICSNVSAAVDYSIDNSLIFELNKDELKKKIVCYEKNIDKYSKESFEFVKSRINIDYGNEITNYFKKII